MRSSPLASSKSFCVAITESQLVQWPSTSRRCMAILICAVPW